MTSLRKKIERALESTFDHNGLTGDDLSALLVHLDDLTVKLDRAVLDRNALSSKYTNVIGRAPLVWSQTLPTEVGEYWTKPGAGVGGECIVFVWRETDGKLLVGSDHLDPDAWWAGPILLPADAKDLELK